MIRTTADIRIVVADDHPLVLRGLAELLAAEPGLHLLARCRDGVEASAALRELEPDVAVIDVHMPGASGLDVLREARETGFSGRIVLLTADIADTEIYEAVANGVDGLVLKNDAPETLVECVRAVAGGRRWLPDALVSAAMGREADRRQRGAGLIGVLTEREREVAALALQQAPNKEIARHLDIAEGTVKIHLNNIYHKLGVASRAALAAALGGAEDQLNRPARRSPDPSPVRRRG